MLGNLTNVSAHDPEREFVRNFIVDVSAGGPGGSYGLRRGRYVVGGWVNSVVIRKQAETAERLRAAMDFTQQHEGPFGYWKDDNGRYWLDVVIGTDDFDTAVRWARTNGEIAIYDTRWDEAINITQMGE